MTPEQLKSIRERAGMTQAQLAKLLRLEMPNGPRTVRHWEKGTRNPSGPVRVLMEMIDAGTFPTERARDE